jgi:hypothetical protein
MISREKNLVLFTVQADLAIGVAWGPEDRIEGASQFKHGAIRDRLDGILGRDTKERVKNRGIDARKPEFRGWEAMLREKEGDALEAFGHAI